MIQTIPDDVPGKNEIKELPEKRAILGTARVLRKLLIQKYVENN